MKVAARRRQLEKRRQAHTALKGQLINKASARYDSGGYRQPGSLKHY